MYVIANELQGRDVLEHSDDVQHRVAGHDVICAHEPNGDGAIMPWETGTRMRSFVEVVEL